MSLKDEFVNNFRQKIYQALEGQFYMSNGDKVTYNPCNDPRYSNCFYACKIKQDGTKKTIIWDPEKGVKVADT